MRVLDKSLGILIASTGRDSLIDLIKTIKKDILDIDRVLIVFDAVNPSENDPRCICNNRPSAIKNDC